jgi:SpoIIAA-like
MEVTMLGVETDNGKGYLELTVDGRIGKEDYAAAVAAVDELLKTHDRLNVLEIVLDIGWVEPEVWWKDIVFHLRHRRFLNRAAIVSDSGWVGPVTRLFAPLYPAAIRTFTTAEIEIARQWARDGEERVDQGLAAATA